MISGKKRHRWFENEAQRAKMRSERKKNEPIGHREFRKLLYIWKRSILSPLHPPTHTLSHSVCTIYRPVSGVATKEVTI
jgi:hypothetical protein